MVFIEVGLMSELLTTNQVKELLNVTNMTLYEWRKRNKIPFIQVGRTIRYRRSDIREILNGFNTQKNVQKETQDARHQ